MTLTNLSRLVPFALAALVACDDDSGSSSATSVEDRLAGAYCTVVKSCFVGDSAENVIILLARELSTADCKAFVTRALVGDDVDEKIAAGTYTVDKAKLDACVDELVESCALSRPGACDEAIDGKIAIGGACTAHEDCSGDAFCEDPDGCGGVCAARKPRGASCEFTSQCSTSAGSTGCSYESNTCVPIEYSNSAAAGAACGEVVTADKITLTRCAAGLDCGEDTETFESECVTPIAVGGACLGDHAVCVQGSICLPTGEDSGACGELPVSDTVGADCKEEWGAADAMFCNPTKFLGCLDGKCAQSGDGSVGATCFFEQDLSGACDRANYCDRATHKCAVKKADGQACESSNDCVSDHCDFTGGETGTCAAPQCGGT